jgi:hypothetical protein
MITLGQWVARRWLHPRDLDGWTPVADDDPRTPEPETRRGGAGPWVVDGRPAQGLHERPHPSGMVDWAAAYHGWMLWRWRGLRMNWSSPLVSPWNPILAQDLVLDELDWSGVCWPEDFEEWTAGAILQGRKTGGYFALRPRSRMKSWVRHARVAGIEVEFYEARCWAFAAQSGTLGERFDLAALAGEYVRVLPGETGEQAARELLEHANVPLIRAAVQHEQYPWPVCGLALGYPPEVTAGLLATREHRMEHRPEGAEFGAYCPFCDRTDWLAARGAGRGRSAAGRARPRPDASAAEAPRGTFGVPRPVRPTTRSEREDTKE